MPGVYAQGLCKDAKPSECPKGDRDNKSEVYFKNKLFQQTEFIYLSLSKNQFIFENGVWGVAPRQVAGTPVPVFTPFPVGRGQGDGDNKSEAYFKNRLFLQAVYISIITENLTQFNPFVYIAQITILKVGNNSLSFFDKKLSNHLIMREKFCIIEK